NDAAAERLSIDREQCYQHLQQLNAAGDLSKKIAEIFTKPDYKSNDDPDTSLYGGGFFNDSDKRKMDIIRSADPEHLKTLSIPFDDQRLPEMLFRYRARNWPESLSSEEQEQWQQYRQQRLTSDNPKILSFDRFFAEIETSRSEQLNEKQLQVLDEIESYGKQLQSELEK
ncbi:MAG: exodeoxyribonuclease I, partial [Methylococcaceae bacterium]|nr:exodeoxyribonuclease I [Methylococcaceae bacterium]